MRKPTTCHVDGCDKVAGVPGTRLGYCSGHYQRLRRHGDPLGSAERINSGRGCAFDGCVKPAAARGYCSTHYTRIKTHGTLADVRAFANAPAGQKWCPQCATYKPNDDFYPSKQTKDGRSGECKPCCRARTASWRERNPDKVADQYRTRDREAMRAYTRDYRKRHPDRAEVYTASRRIRMRTSERESFTKREIFDRDGWRCHLCGERIIKSRRYPDPRSPSIDHLIPVVDGGPHTRANVAAAHLVCNLRRKARGEAQLLLFG